MSDSNCLSDKQSAAYKQYTRDFLLASLLYAIVLIASVSIIVSAKADLFDLPHWAVILIALAPVAPVLLMLHVFLTLFRKLDELQRRLQSEAILIAAGVVGFGSLAYGFLENAAGFPSIPDVLLWIFPAMLAVWGVAQPLVARRYR